MFRDEPWIWPATALTTGLVAFALLFMGDHSGVIPVLMLLPFWLLAAFAMALALAVPMILSMMKAGQDRPIRRLYVRARAEWRCIALVSFAMVLAGLNMIAFMWAKPLLNYLIPFWADPYLAYADRVIFQTDPYLYLSWLNSEPMSIFYHRGWFALMIAALLLVLMHKSTVTKSALMLTYFILWSIVGPVVHSFLPAGGPVFYQRLGYGAEFAAISAPPNVVELADYLWRIFTTTGYGGGAGISAMPSLHIATTVWIVLAFFLYAKRWLVLIAPASFLIFLLSISLGWHYAVDGIAGGALAIGAYWLSMRWFSREMVHASTAVGTARAVQEPNLKPIN